MAKMKTEMTVMSTQQKNMDDVLPVPPTVQNKVKICETAILHY